MNMPQKTPKAVNRLRVLFLVMVMNISSHLSKSILIILICSKCFDWSPATVFMYSVAAMPATIPIYPKKVVIVTLSAMISHKIDIGLAPNALRIPNSRVRSFTVISMILLTPTMPLSKVNMPITQMAIVRMRIPFSCCRN